MVQNLISESSLETLNEAKDKLKSNFSDRISSFSEKELSKKLLKEDLDKNNQASINAHLQSLNSQLDKILNKNSSHLKHEVLYFEFAKGITLFDMITGVFDLRAIIRGANYISSQHFYKNAIGSYTKNVLCLYIGGLEFSCIPLNLRLGIEIYFKNLIGYTVAYKTNLTGKYKDKVNVYPLSISEILKFFSHKKYKKYIRLPMDINIIRNVNYWSNNLVHTGITTFPWQSMSAIDFLKPLFYTSHENGHLHIEGYNYLNLEYTQDNLNSDLNKFLSNNFRKIEVITAKRDDNKPPFEGAYYYPKHNKANSAESKRRKDHYT